MNVAIISRKKRCSAFTLPEILVVLSIVALLLAMVFPRMQQTKDQVLYQSVADQLLADLESVRAEAAVQMASGYLEVTPTGYRTYLTIHDVETPLKEVQLPSGLNLTHTGSVHHTIRFAPDRTAPQFGTIRLAGGSYERYFIVYQTGRIRVSDVPPTNTKE